MDHGQGAPGGAVTPGVSPGGQRHGPRPAIAGWAPPSDADGRPSRGVGDLLGEAFGAYRRHWRELLVLSAITEGLVTLIALPYTLSAGSQALDVMRSGFSSVPGSAALLPRLVTDPALAALGGMLSVVPLGGTLILIAAVTALLLAPQPEAHTWRGALGRALEHRGPILGPVVALAVFAGLIQLGITSLGRADATAVPASAGVSQELLVAAVLLLLFMPALVIVTVYLAIRWSVAVPALVMESATLRRALARSVRLTRRRTLLVGLTLLAVYGVTGVLGGAVTMLALVTSWTAGSQPVAWPLVVLPALANLAVRVVLAPIGAIVPALLYRELRLAADGTSPTGRSANAGPDPSRSAGVP